ncbi:thioredoxin trx1 [Coemansia sp. RSA 1199]|nr:thioredoxin trx1 [Coemansia sp. RSA 1199]
MDTPTVHKLKDEQSFNDFIAKNKFVAINFSSKRIRESILINPTFTELSKEHPEIKFVQLDVDEMHEMHEIDNIAEIYKVSEIPTFRFLHDSESIDYDGVGGLTNCIKVFSQDIKYAPGA